MEEEKIKKYLKQHLSDRRYRHSLGVAEEAKRLARHYGADEEKAHLAGLVHDCAKEIEAQEAIRLLREEYCVTPDAMKLCMPTLLHGMLGACIAQSRFDIYDPEVLDAVCYHTTGKSNMSLLAKIIFIADYIEPGRDYPDVDALRQLTYRDLNEAMLFGIDFTIRDLLKKRKTIHPDMIHCRNDLVICGEGKPREKEVAEDAN